MCNDVSRKLLPLQREGWDGHGFEKLALRHVQADVPHPPSQGARPDAAGRRSTGAKRCFANPPSNPCPPLEGEENLANFETVH